MVVCVDPIIKQSASEAIKDGEHLPMGNIVEPERPSAREWMESSLVALEKSVPNAEIRR